MPTPPWETLSSECAGKFRFLSLFKNRMRRARDGREGDFLKIDAPDWVLALATDTQRRILLARQYRFGTGEYSWEPPGGVVERGESAQAAAARELLEEAGCAGEEAQDLGWCHVNPPLQSNRAHFVWFKRCRAVAAPKPEPDEDIELKWFPLADAFAMAREGGVRHMGAVAALLKLENALKA